MSKPNKLSALATVHTADGRIVKKIRSECIMNVRNARADYNAETDVFTEKRH